ncbi:hypothetical protein PDE_05913 [Penicillium oxalicum 114-2]|uniref:HNH nuclease domain-containing protein n=1 Tax=Penicillium oxalicum (strain 114-2 / CGMCC 5302) TaxID=933388 RepID=S7ZKX5_PENO1|nr:hypothetical protein PDE_05913 [Penicillium oxalicum 114-2]
MAPADNDHAWEITSRWEDILEWLLSTCWQTVITTATQSGAFSETVKSQLRAIYDQERPCWVCQETDADCAHVFAKEDSQANLWAKIGLIPHGASLKARENAIFLCKTCHYRFDHASHPGLVFFPADLEFFIEFEKADQSRRKEAAQTGAHIGRRSPSAAEYKIHQMEQGLVGPHSIGGLYRTVMLAPFHSRDLARQIGSSILETRTKVKEWHGEPMYTLRRAFQLLGNIQNRLLAPEIKKQLQELMELYTSDPIEDRDDDPEFEFDLRHVNRYDRGTKRPHPGPDDTDNAEPPGDARGGLDKNKDSENPQPGREGGQDDFDRPSKRVKRGCRSVDEAILRERHRLILTPHRTLSRRWQLGPLGTAEDAIRIHTQLMAPI